jgi:hypothetical protein
LENIFEFFPNVAKAGGIQSQASEGEVVVSLLRTLSNAGSEFLRLSRRVNNIAASTPSFEFTNGDIKELVILL